MLASCLGFLSICSVPCAISRQTVSQVMLDLGTGVVGRLTLRICATVAVTK